MISTKIKLFLSLSFVLTISCTNRPSNKKEVCSLDKNYSQIASFKLPENKPENLNNQSFNFNKEINETFNLKEDNKLINKKHFSIDSHILFVYTYKNPECGDISFIGVIDNKKRILIHNIGIDEENIDIRWKVHKNNLVLYVKGYFSLYNNLTLLTSELTFDFYSNNINIVVDDGLTTW